MKAYQLVIFDWEGTLSDTDGAALHQLAKLTESVGLKPFDKTKARQLLSSDFFDLMKALYGETLASHQILGLKDKFRQNQYLFPNEVCLYRGVKSMLAALKQKGVWLGIATGKGRESLNNALERAGIADYFFATRTPSECACKPAPDMLEALIEMSGTDKENTLMVGDSLCDLEAAQNAGVDCVIIDTAKLNDDKQLIELGALEVVHSIHALKKWLI